MGHTVGRPADLPHAGKGPLALFIGGGLLFALLVVLYFVLPMLKTNQEQEHDTRRLPERGQDERR